MSEILNRAYLKPKAINQNRHHGMVNKADWPKYIWEFYPIAQDYYHEFNPYFVHLIPNRRVIPEFKVFTVRDGAYTFADFIVKNFRNFPTWDTHFLIPENYRTFIPENSRDKFFAYRTSQAGKPDPATVKTVTVFCLMCTQYFGNYDKIREKLAFLKEVPPEVKLEVCLSQRRNVLHIEERENFHYIHIPELVREAAGNREIRWLRMHDLMEKSYLRNNHLIDLMDGNLMTCDSYLHYWFLSRGGTVSHLPVDKGEKSLFDLDISFSQRLHVSPLPDAQSMFTELLFFSKTTKEDLITNPGFHKLVGEIISS